MWVPEASFFRGPPARMGGTACIFWLSMIAVHDSAELAVQFFCISSMASMPYLKLQCTRTDQHVTGQVYDHPVPAGAQQQPSQAQPVTQSQAHYP